MKKAVGDSGLLCCSEFQQDLFAKRPRVAQFWKNTQRQNSSPFVLQVGRDTQYYSDTADVYNGQKITYFV